MRKRAGHFEVSDDLTDDGEETDDDDIKARDDLDENYDEPDDFEEVILRMI